MTEQGVVSLLRWALGLLVGFILGCAGFFVGTVQKPNETRVKEIISREVKHPWPIDRPIVMERLRSSEEQITEIAVEQKIQGKQITAIDKNVGILLDRIKE